MIQTTEFALTKKEYLKVIALLRLRSSWLSFVFMITVALYFLPRFTTDSIATFLVLFTPLYILFTFLYLVYYVNAKDNRNIYKSHQLVFNTDKIVSYTGTNSVFDTPTTSEVAISQIIKTKKVDHFWLLYVAKNQFIIVPARVFISIEDQKAFEKLIHPK